jgi:hypothetical protein
MIRFFLKKAFFDGWDNLISLIAMNLGYIVVLLTVYGAIELASVSVWGALLLGFFGVIVYALYTGMVAIQVKEHVWYSRPGFVAFFHGFTRIWRHALLYVLFVLFVLSAVLFIIPFYLSHGSLFFLVLGMVVIWLVIAVVLALQYYFALAVQLSDDKPLKTAKKAFILVIDNIGFSLFFALYHLVNIMFTVFFVTLIPGGSGIELSHQVAVKLLMSKYDYLEEHAEANRKRIPWDLLLQEEREKVGHRSLKGMIFPWKE